MTEWSVTSKTLVLIVVFSKVYIWSFEKKICLERFEVAQTRECAECDTLGLI